MDTAWAGVASAAVTGVCSVIAAVVAVRWTGRTNSNSAESAAARIVAEQQLAALKLPAGAKPGEGDAAAALADKPFDTRISADVLNGSLVIKTPPTFENIVALLVSILFTSFWGVAIFVAALFLLIQFVPMSGDNVEVQSNPFSKAILILFLIVWICGVTYALSRMMRSILGEIVTIVGGRTLMFSTDTLVVHSGAFGLSRNQVYLLKYVRQLKDDKNTTTSRENQGAIVFEYGRKKIVVGGFTEVEARWARHLMQRVQPDANIFALQAQSG